MDQNGKAKPQEQNKEEDNLLNEKQNDKNEDNEEEELGEKIDEVRFRIPFLAGIFTFQVANTVMELNYGTFIMTFVVQEMGWSKRTGNDVTSVYFTGYMVARLLGIVLVKVIPIQVLLSSTCILTFASLIPITFFAHAHSSIIWICSVAIGLAMSTIFPTSCTWAGEYIKLSKKTISTFHMGASLGQVMTPVLLNIFYGDYGIVSFMYIMFVASCIELVLYVILQLFASLYGGHLKSLKNPTYSELNN